MRQAYSLYLAEDERIDTFWFLGTFEEICRLRGYVVQRLGQPRAPARPIGSPRLDHISTHTQRNSSFELDKNETATSPSL